MLDHANLEAMATQMASHFQLTPADHALLVLPVKPALRVAPV